MKITLYTTSTDTRYLDKNLNRITSVDCTIKDSADVSNPNIIIKSLADNVLANINYAHISVWGRYYYITNVTVLTGGRVELALKCDVLMSFKDSIRNATAFVTRNEQNYDRLIPDERITLRKGTKITMKDIATMWNNNANWQYYVTLMGATPTE